MGTISVTLPIDTKGKFRIRDRIAAKRFVEELEKIGERVTPIDDLFGIWADHPENVDEMIKEIRKRNNKRD